MESFTAQSENIPEKREIGCLATTDDDDGECKKQKLDGILGRNEANFVIDAKFKLFSDSEENDATVEKADKKRRRSSEKRVRFNEVVDVCEEPVPRLLNVLDDGCEDFAMTRPLRSIVASQLKRDDGAGGGGGDCINVADFQERYNHLNKGTSVWRRRQRQQFNKKSFGDFIGSQDFTAPLATMDEIDCFSDESPDFVFNDFDDSSEDQTFSAVVAVKESTIVHDESVWNDSGYEDGVWKDHSRDVNEVECFTRVESILINTSSASDHHHLVLNEDFTKDHHIGQDAENTSSTEMSNYQDVELPRVFDEMVYSVDDDGGGVVVDPLYSPASDETMEPSKDNNGVSEMTDAVEMDNDIREGTMIGESSEGQQLMKERNGHLATHSFRNTDEFLTTVAEADDRVVRRQDVVSDECLATNEIVKIDESRLPVPGDITTVLESKVPVPEDILSVLESKVPVLIEIRVDGSRVPEPDELNVCSLPQESVMIDSMAVPEKMEEMNIPGVSDTEVPAVPDTEIPVAAVPVLTDVLFMANAAIQSGDDSHLLMTEERLAEQRDGGMADNEEMRQSDGNDHQSTTTTCDTNEMEDDHVTCSEKEQKTSATMAGDDDDSKRPDTTPVTIDDDNVRNYRRIGIELSAKEESLPAITDKVLHHFEWISLPENSPGVSTDIMSSMLHSSLTDNDDNHDDDDNDGDDDGDDDHGGQLEVNYSGLSDHDDSSSAASSHIQPCNAEAPIPPTGSFHFHASNVSSHSNHRFDSHSSFPTSSNSRDGSNFFVRHFNSDVLIPNLVWLFHRDDDDDATTSPGLEKMGKGHVVLRKVPPPPPTRVLRRMGSAGVTNPRGSRGGVGASRLVTEGGGGGGTGGGGVVRKMRPRSGCN